VEAARSRRILLDNRHRTTVGPPDRLEAFAHGMARHGKAWQGTKAKSSVVWLRGLLYSTTQSVAYYSSWLRVCRHGLSHSLGAWGNDHRPSEVAKGVMIAHLHTMANWTQMRIGGLGGDAWTGQLQRRGSRGDRGRGTT